MMKPKEWFALAVLMGLVQPMFGATQNVVPYTAHYKETVSTKKSNDTETAEGYRERKSDGSLLSVNFAEGTQKEKDRSIYDSSQSILYRLNNDQKQAIGTRMHVGGLIRPRDAALGHETVSGVATTIFPIHAGDHGPVIGKIWVADGADLIVKSHSEYADTVIDFLLTDVVLYGEPDAAHFRVPAGYAVSVPQ